MTSFFVELGRSVWCWLRLRRIIVDIGVLSSKWIESIVKCSFFMDTKCFWKIWWGAIWQMTDFHVVDTISRHSLILHRIRITRVLMCSIIHKSSVLLDPSLRLIYSFERNRIACLQLSIHSRCSWQPSCWLHLADVWLRWCTL